MNKVWNGDDATLIKEIALDAAWWLRHPSPTAVPFAGGKAMLLTPFRAGSAHVVQLGAIGIENVLRPLRDRRAETLANSAREGSDERPFGGDGRACRHDLESHHGPLSLWPNMNLDTFRDSIAVAVRPHGAENPLDD
jgi:hypothetical protein